MGRISNLSIAIVLGVTACPVSAQMGPPTTRVLISNLQRRIDMKDFQNPMSLKEAIQLIYQKAEHDHKVEVPILVNTAAFKAENPDSSDIYDTPIKFPPFPRHMPIATALRLALDQVPEENATYLVRNGWVEVTTYERASVRNLLRERVTAVFEKQPLAEAIEEISSATGLTVLVDPRIANDMKTPVTAFFRGDVAAESALRLLAEMASLKIAVLPTGVYLTDPATADRLQREQRRWLIRDPAELNGKRALNDPFAG